MKKCYLTLLIFSFFTSSVFAQPRIAAQAVIGGTGNDQLAKMCLTPDGGILTTGASNSNKSFYKSQNSKGSYDYWIVKSVYDKTTGKAVEQWDRTIGGDSTDILVATVPTRDGGFILGGNSTSGKSGNKTDTSHGGYDVWLVRIDSIGNVVWDKTIGGATNDRLQSLDTTNDGGYIMLYWHDIAIGAISYLALLKLDAAGNEMWKQDTLSGNKSYQSVHQTTDGGYLFAATPEYTHLMIKTDANLNELWRAECGGRGYTFNYEAKELSDGSYILIGYDATEYANGSGDDDPGFYYDYYVSIYKTTYSGKILWSLNEYARVSPIYKIAFEELSTGGYLYGYDYSPKDSRWSNFLVTKIDDRGMHQWIDSVRTKGVSSIGDLKEIKAGRYIYGTLSYAGIGADKIKDSLGGGDYWFIQVKDTAVTNAPLIAGSMAAPVLQKQDKLAIYPNPVRDRLYVQVAGTATVSLADSNGKVIIQQTIQSNGFINVRQLSAGVYYLKNITTGIAKKVMVIK